MHKKTEPRPRTGRGSLGGGYLLSHFRSTIGVVRLNFSVRNGKRWNPHAITTLLPFRRRRPAPVMGRIHRREHAVRTTAERDGLQEAARKNAGPVRPRAASRARVSLRVTGTLQGTQPPTRTGARLRTESSRVISTARLNVSPRVHLPPINVVVCNDPQRRSHLEAGFALRCFQRLSEPDAATRQCPGRDNRHTGGRSNTVLSY